jgi:ribonuclease HI
MNFENDEQHKKSLPLPQLRVFHVCGAGARPDGTCSGFAWVMLRTGKKETQWVDGLTKEEAEYLGLIAVLEYVGEGKRVMIWMDSPIVSGQFNYPVPVKDKRLDVLLSKARRLEEEKWLRVETQPIRRKGNLAAVELFDPAAGGKAFDYQESKMDEENDRNRNKARKRLRVTNLADDTSLRDLIRLFSKHFDVLDVAIYPDGGVSSGEAEASVTVYEDDAADAKYWAHKQSWRGRKLRVRVEENSW